MTNDINTAALHALHTLATQAHGPYINATHICAGYTCVPIGQGPDGLARAILELAADRLTATNETPTMTPSR